MKVGNLCVDRTDMTVLIKMWDEGAGDPLDSGTQRGERDCLHE